jgi:hypothetical protein
MSHIAGLNFGDGSIVIGAVVIVVCLVFLSDCGIAGVLGMFPAILHGSAAELELSR